MEEMSMWFSLSVYTLLLLLTYYSVGSKNFLRKVGFKKTNVLRDSATAAGLSMLMLVASMVITIVFISAGMGEDTAKVTENIMSFPLLYLLIILVIGPVVEEVFFRGYLQRKTNLLLASAAFSYFHIVYGSVSELVGAFVLGMMLGKAFERTRNLYVPVLAHYMYNFVIISIVLTAS